MKTCPACGHIDIDSILRDEMGSKVPEGVKLYDFGDGVIQMPRTDVDGSYLTSNMAALYKDLGDGTILIMTFTIPHVKSRQQEEALMQAARIALDFWPEKAVVVNPGDPFPKP